jgi:hypothetical protein
MARRSAESSVISSRTSMSLALRFSRFFFDAFSSRDARQVSSDFAAARANSSHSRWRANAASGVIAGGLAPAAADFSADGAGESVMTSSPTAPPRAHCAEYPRSARVMPISRERIFGGNHDR